MGRLWGGIPEVIRLRGKLHVAGGGINRECGEEPESAQAERRCAIIKRARSDRVIPLEAEFILNGKSPFIKWPNKWLMEKWELIKFTCRSMAIVTMPNVQSISRLWRMKMVCSLRRFGHTDYSE